MSAFTRAPSRPVGSITAARCGLNVCPPSTGLHASFPQTGSLNHRLGSNSWARRESGCCDEYATLAIGGGEVNWSVNAVQGGIATSGVAAAAAWSVRSAAFGRAACGTGRWAGGGRGGVAGRRSADLTSMRVSMLPASNPCKWGKGSETTSNGPKCQPHLHVLDCGGGQKEPWYPLLDNQPDHTGWKRPNKP
ncbi:unnamed protein product, partial [Iphiclides podalirius]